MSQERKDKGINATASILTTSAAAVNAVPVWGQFASAGLAIAAGLTKLFGNIEGPRKKKRARRRRAVVNARESLRGEANQQGQQQAGGQLNTGGQMPMQMPGAPEMVTPPTPVFTGAPNTGNDYNG